MEPLEERIKPRIKSKIDLLLRKLNSESVEVKKIKDCVQPLVLEYQGQAGQRESVKKIIRRETISYLESLGYSEKNAWETGWGLYIYKKREHS